MQNRTLPPRFASRACTYAAIAFVVSSCGGSGGGEPTTPSNNTNQTIASVAITGNATTVAVGSTITLGASAFNSSGTAVSATFTWASNNTAVALVGASTGVVSGVTAGNATVTASAGGRSSTRVITVTGGGPPLPPPLQANIEMPGSLFSPNAVTIGVGGTVSFVFGSTAHNVFFAGGAGAPSNIPETTNAVVQRSFPVAGQFNINCTLHAGMTGVITVQ